MRPWIWWLGGISSTVICGWWWWNHPDWWHPLINALSSDSLQQLATAIRAMGWWAPLISIALMILQSVIAPLPGSLVAAVNGVVFGVWWGSLISWIGGMAGAIVTFWFGRWFRERLSERWARSHTLHMIERLGQQHGFWIVVIARVTPLISLDAIGYLAGISQMRFRDYLLANAIGVLPGMVAYTVLGHDLAFARDSVWRIGVVLTVVMIGFLLGRWWLTQQPVQPKQ